MSDVAGFVVSLISCHLAARTSSKRMSFGYGRFEVLGALFSVIFIWILSGGLLYMALTRIVNTDYKIDEKVMITMAGIGVVINAFMAFVLSYDHSNSHEKANVKKSTRLKTVQSKINLTN